MEFSSPQSSPAETPGISPPRLSFPITPFVEVIGGGSPGLKAGDLIETADAWVEKGVIVRSGIGVGNDAFREFVDDNRLERGSGEPPSLDDVRPGEMMRRAAHQVLERYPDTVLAFRSSALDERGGTGIYRSVFFSPNGARDEQRFEALLRMEEVYLSAFSKTAAAFGAKHHTEPGMGCLVQPVVGAWHGDHFMPVLAGSGYTNYEGRPLLRVVRGLGTRAVRQNEEFNAVVFEGDEASRQNAWGQLSQQQKADAVSRDGNVEVIPTPHELFDIRRAVLDRLLDTAAALKAAGRNLYFEWAIESVQNPQPQIVQSAPYEEKERNPLAPEIRGKLYVEGEDIVNHGEKICERIVYVPAFRWNEATRRRLERLNNDFRNYLLIVPQECSSSQQSGMIHGDGRLALEHFSNAAAVHEGFYATTTPGVAQYLLSMGLSSSSHDEKRAGLHFQQICKREDILFIGAQLTPLPDLQYDETPEGIRIYGIKAQVINDTIAGRGRIYLLAQERVETSRYSRSDITGWSHELRGIALTLDKSPELANHFFMASYLLPRDEAGVNFKPLVPDPEIVREDGPEAISKTLEIMVNGEGRKRVLALPAGELLLGYLTELKSAWDAGQVPGGNR